MNQDKQRREPPQWQSVFLPFSTTLAAIAAATFCYGLGSIIGPLIPALIMHFTVPGSLFIIAATMYILILTIMLTTKT
ncbi:MAG: MFS transporter, partial [Deltaproteobacteria bacterium]|nr:MFS transporter [Deltaproteobacteria bacterium]